MTVLYWAALYLVAHKATNDLRALEKGSLRRDVVMFALIGEVAALLTLAIG